MIRRFRRESVDYFLSWKKMTRVVSIPCMEGLRVRLQGCRTPFENLRFLPGKMGSTMLILKDGWEA